VEDGNSNWRGEIPQDAPTPVYEVFPRLEQKQCIAKNSHTKFVRDKILPLVTQSHSYGLVSVTRHFFPVQIQAKLFHQVR